MLIHWTGARQRARKEGVLIMVFSNGCKRHSDCFTCPFADCVAYDCEPPAQRVPLRGGCQKRAAKAGIYAAMACPQPGAEGNGSRRARRDMKKITVQCSNCGKNETIVFCLIEASRLIADGWNSYGGVMYCPECSSTWDKRNRHKTLSGTANTLKCIDNLWFRAQRLDDKWELERNGEI